MPTYRYLCKPCDLRFEVQKKYSDPDPKCPSCQMQTDLKLASLFAKQGSSSSPAAEIQRGAGSEAANSKVTASEDKPAHSCPGSRRDELIKKYEKTVRPPEIRGT